MLLDNTYLTEEKLGKILDIVYPNEEIIHNKKIPEYEEKCRPDYRLPNLKLIFEFDGSTHFTNPKRIIMDEKNDLFYESLGYKVIRVPYFVQMDANFFINILNLNIGRIYNYPNGFIDEKAQLPAEFCNLGIRKFYDLLKVGGLYEYCCKEIFESLGEKVKLLGDERLVYPTLTNTYIQRKL